MARTEYIAVAELSRNGVLDLGVYNTGIRQYAVDSVNPTQLANILYGMITEAVKFAADKTTGLGDVAESICQGIQEWTIATEKSDIRKIINQGTSALGTLAGQMAANPSWQQVRVQIGVIGFSQGFKVITSVGNILAVKVNGSWQN